MVLTNMTPICFQQLLVPSSTSDNTMSQSENKAKHLDGGSNTEALDVLLCYLQMSLESFTSVDPLHKYNPDQLQPILLAFVLASKSSRPIRKYFRFKILPPLRDEVKRLPSEGGLANLVEIDSFFSFNFFNFPFFS